MNRKKRLLWNTTTSVIYQLISIICGFVLPRLILGSYGSRVNGLVNSISQFLSIITFLELGVGAVVKSSLYKPLVNNDHDGISKITRSANRFFRRIALILLVYSVLLVILYPMIINREFDAFYTGTLVLTLCFNSFFQYYFGIVDGLLLVADQRGYILYGAQIITITINTLLCASLIKLGASIQIVKLTTALVYLLRPIGLRIYINKKYKINRKIQYSGEPIKQKWNGIAQHISAVVLQSTDVIVLTLFSTLSNVSIYSVYYLIMQGLSRAFSSVSAGFQSLLGELLAKDERDNLLRTFSFFDWIIHSLVIIVFGCTCSSIVQFVQIYTRGLMDANYIQVPFAMVFTIANAIHTIRTPYVSLIMAAGHFKQTQHIYIIATILNIIISVLSVFKYGLIGVAIGTLVAMTYQTVSMSLYDSKHILKINNFAFIKHFLVDVAWFLSGFFVCNFFTMRESNWASWVVLAIEDILVYFAIGVLINYLFYKKEMNEAKVLIRKRKA